MVVGASMNSGSYNDDAELYMRILKERTKRYDDMTKRPHINDCTMSEELMSLMINNKPMLQKGTFSINEELTSILKQVSVSMTDTVEDVIKKSALNTTKKYLVYWHEVDTLSHKIYSHFSVYDSDEKRHDGYLVDLDEIREYLKEQPDEVKKLSRYI